MSEKRGLKTEKRKAKPRCTCDPKDIGLAAVKMGRTIRATAPNGRELFVAKNEAGCWGVFCREGPGNLSPWYGNGTADLQNHATRESAQARLRAYAEKLGWAVTEEKTSRKGAKKTESQPGAAVPHEKTDTGRSPRVGAIRKKLTRATDSQPEAVFSADCLDDLSAWLKALTKEAREG